MFATRISPFQIPPASNAYPRNMPGKTFLPNWWSLDWSRAEIGYCCPKKNHQAFEWFYKSPFTRSFHHLPGGLGHFADFNSIPQNQPTIFHPSLIATAQQTSQPLFCVPLFQQYHSSQIDEVSKFDDSMINLHMICRIPTNCQCE